MSEKKDEYCGLVCGFLLDDLQKILDQCITHAKYDPEFAPVMVQRLIDKCEETKTELMHLVIQSKFP